MNTVRWKKSLRKDHEGEQQRISYRASVQLMNYKEIFFKWLYKDFFLGGKQWKNTNLLKQHVIE